MGPAVPSVSVVYRVRTNFWSVYNCWTGACGSCISTMTWYVIECDAIKAIVNETISLRDA